MYSTGVHVYNVKQYIVIVTHTNLICFTIWFCLFSFLEFLMEDHQTLQTMDVMYVLKIIEYFAIYTWFNMF
jgi:hypothetical protein